MKKFKMSEIQAQAILDMRLQRLTGLERKKVEEEYLELIKLIATLKGILESKTKRMNIIKEELLTLKKNYGDQRRTEIKEEEEEFTIEDLIAEENMLITISHNGYIKRLGIDAYRRQGRGGKGVIGMETREEDFVEHLFHRLNPRLYSLLHQYREMPLAQSPRDTGGRQGNQGEIDHQSSGISRR